MGATYKLYIVNEQKLPLQDRYFGLTDQAKQEMLVKSVETTGAAWETLELRESAFRAALEAIDEEIGGTKFLPVLAFNNSPGNVLGNYGDCPLFGYFTPAQAQDLNACLEELDEGVTADLVAKCGPVAETVLHAFASAASEAAQRRAAIAVLHL